MNNYMKKKIILIGTMWLCFFANSLSFALDQNLNHKKELPACDKNGSSNYDLTYVTPDGTKIFILQNAGCSSSTIYSSNNAGQSWQKIITNDKHSFAAMRGNYSDNNQIYLAGFEESAQLSLNNNAQKDSRTITNMATTATFHYLSHDYEDFAAANFDAIYFTPDSKNIFIGGQDSDDDVSWLFTGTKTSSDNANAQLTWSAANIETCGMKHQKLGWIGALNVNAISGDEHNIYLATLAMDPDAVNGGICFSQDTGKTWNKSLTFPMPSAAAVFVTKKTGTIFAAGFNEEDTDDGEKITTDFYISKNHGEQWSPLKIDGNEKPLITTINGAEDGSTLYLGTKNNDGGLWIGKEKSQEMHFYKVALPTAHSCKANTISNSSNGKIVAVSCLDDATWISTDYGNSWHEAKI